MMNERAKSTKKTVTKILYLVIVLSLCFIFAGISGTLGGSAAARQPVNGNYFFADYNSRADVISAGHALNETIMEEGITLLKNRDNVLPLKSSQKMLSVFGKNSVNLVYGGSGSGAGSSAGRIDLKTSLEGAGFTVNPTLDTYFRNNGSARGSIPGYTVVAGHPTAELPPSGYTQAVKNSYANYSDAALIVISRTGGESSDLPRSMASSFTSTQGVFSGTVLGARSNTDHYLQLDQNETDMIKHVCDNFNNVVLLINSGSQMEVGFLDDPNHYAYHSNLKAALWIGMPGTKGLNAVGKVLNGTVTPSGRTVDTYARDFKADPTWQNFSNNLFTNGNIYTNGESNGNKHIEYEEGVYMGYRYWETRGFTEGITAYTTDGTAAKPHINGTSTKTWADWYSAHVVYPIGYGLSYTTFNQQIVSTKFADGATLGAGDIIEIDVRVTNTGNVYSGKEVVQLYYTAPYKTNGIEKSHVVLGVFEKTELLAPGQSQTVTLKLPVRDMASYDFEDKNINLFYGYELDAGSYDIKLSRNAHQVIDSVTYELPAIRYETSKATGNEVGNLFDDVSAGVTHRFSRLDFAGTFPVVATERIAMSAEVLAKSREWNRLGGTDNNITDSAADPWYTDTMPTTGASNGLTLSDMVGLDYDDPLWDNFLDQMVVGTSTKNSGMIPMVSYGGWRITGYSALGVPDTLNGDGPSGWGNGRGVASDQTQYCSDTVLASTYNKDIAYQKGIMIGNEGLYGDGTGGSDGKYSGWYAPAVNIHRSPFSGRNFEYFSEDGYITGAIAAEVVRGAQEKGVYCFVKHFGVNDQETDRDGLLTWATEQSMREIYLKGFELCVKKGGATAMMSGLNRIGAVWTGGSYALLTQLLRNEWGFKGVVITDYCESRYYINLNQMIRAGGDLALLQNNRTVNFALNTPTTVLALRNASKNICYAAANSLAMNTATPVAGSMTFVSEALGLGERGEAYQASVATASITLAGGITDNDPDITYSLKTGSTLLNGLTLNSDGTISGTPTVTGTNHQFTVVATYKNDTLAFTWKKEAQFALNIASPDGSIIYDRNGTTLPAAVLGAAYTQNIGDATLSKSGSANPINYSLKYGAPLPDGLTLSEDGVISGTPTKVCNNYEFTVVVRSKDVAPVEATMTISVGYSGMVFTGKTLATGSFGAAYHDKVVAAENAGEGLKYSLKEGSKLPTGLTLTSGGYVTGTPTEAVTDRIFTVVAESEFAAPVEAEYKITIGIGFNFFELGTTTKDKAYEFDASSYAQGAETITYKLKDGTTLPDGLSLSANGKITGTPTVAGSYDFTLVAEANGYVSAEIKLHLFVAETGDGGCSGVIYGGGSAMLIILSVLTLAGITIAIKKRGMR